MTEKVPLLPADCLGLAAGDPLVERWKAGPREPDFAALFLSAANLVFDWVLAARGPRGGWEDALAGPARDLYSGLPGIAVFAAAHAAATGRPAGAELAEEIARGLFGSRPEEMPFGGAVVGLGSVVYALLAVAAILERPALAERAFELGCRAAGQAAGSAASFDVIGGHAGSILVLDRLLAAAAALGRPSATAGLRRRMAEETAALLACARPAAGGRAFGAAGEPPASGFAHGASGAAAALARASGHLAIPGLSALLAEVLAFERSLYLPEARNWLPDTTEKVLNPIGWCRGAPGIALARMLLLSSGLAPVEEIETDLAQALRSTLVLPVQPFDHLCCGNLGRAEVLLSAHERSGAAEDLAAARWIGLHVLRRAKSRGALAVGSSQPDDPSFFQGASGLGYAFLRLAFPGRFPSILSFR